MDSITLIINSFIALLLSYIAFAGYVKRFCKYIRNKITHFYDAQELTRYIVEWYYLVDEVGLREVDPLLPKIDRIEREIDFLFRRYNIQKQVILKTNRKFRNRFLRYCGIQKKYFSEVMFKREAHINTDVCEITLGLCAAAHKRKYSIDRIPLIFFWDILKGNYYLAKRHFPDEMKEGKSAERISAYASIDMIVKMIRLYFHV